MFALSSQKAQLRGNLDTSPKFCKVQPITALRGLTRVVEKWRSGGVYLATGLEVESRRLLSLQAAQLVHRINSSSSYSLDQDAITNI